MKEKLIIVPEVGKIFDEVITSIVDSVNEYFRDNDKNIKFTKSQGTKIPDVLAKEGYLVVRIRGNDMLLVYLPVVVSNKQKKWIDDHKDKLKKINTVGVFNYKKENAKPENLMSVIELVKEATSKNKKYNRK